MSDTLTFENIDRSVQIEMRPQGLPGGIVPRLYSIARGEGGPLSLAAASALQEPAIQRVACVTGIVGGPLGLGEVDGPLGASVLAEALCQVGKRADVVVPEAMLPVVEAIRKAIGGSFGVADQDRAAAPDYDAAVTMEKLGRNRKGVTHFIFGNPLETQRPVADEFIEALNGTGKLTIGIGDGGNEIGFGAIFDKAREFVPYGADCGCPCGDGVVTSTATKILFPAAVSNFGAYAITAALGVLETKPLLLASPDRVMAGLEAAVQNGCLDGGSFQPGLLGDDGVPVDGVRAVVTILRTVAQQHFATSPRHR